MRFVLVAQMGKVGSSTVTDSIEAVGFRRVRVKPHKFKFRWLGRNPNANIIVHSHGTKPVRALMEAVRDRGLQEQTLVVSLVRDVLHRNISAFFQNVSNKAIRHWYLGAHEDVLKIDFNELMELFRTRHLSYLRDKIADWPDKFSAATGIPLLDRPFDTKRGVSLLREPDGVRFVMFQVEKLSQNWDVLREALEMPTLDMLVTHKSEEKWYGALYDRFKTHYRPNSYELDACYNSSLMRHYYSDEDRARFRGRWKVAESD